MPLDFEKLNEKKNKRFGKGWTPDPGENNVRVLPPTSDYFSDMIGYIALEFRTHFVRLDGQDIKVFRCLRDFEEKCPACAFYYDHRNDDDPGVEAVANKFKPSNRFAFNILDLDDPGAGVQTYECGVKVHNEILKYAANESWGDILAADEEGRGFTITLTPPHQGDNNSDWNQYSVMPHPNKKSVVHHLTDGWKEELDALAGDVPERADKSEVQSVVDTAAVEVGLVGNVSGGTAPQTSDSTPKKAPQKSSGFSPEVSEPDVSEPVAKQSEASEPEPQEVEETAPSVESTGSGPEIDPDTGDPVCFGEFPGSKDNDQYPCNECDVVRDCHMKKLGL